MGKDIDYIEYHPALFLVDITKKIIKTLPNKENLCNKVNYPTCVMESITSMAKEKYNCTLRFLNKDGKFDDCSNSLTLDLIRKLKKALKQLQYEHCMDTKPCNDVQYMVNLKEAEDSFARFGIRYKSFNVEHLEDSYVYSFITIFSEVGGSIGILVGLSCMTVVDSLIEFYRKVFRV